MTSTALCKHLTFCDTLTYRSVFSQTALESFQMAKETNLVEEASHTNGRNLVPLYATPTKGLPSSNGVGKCTGLEGEGSLVYLNIFNSTAQREQISQVCGTRL